MIICKLLCLTIEHIRNTTRILCYIQRQLLSQNILDRKILNSSEQFYVDYIILVPCMPVIIMPYTM